MEKVYFNIKTDDLTKLSIERAGYFDCLIKDTNGKCYNGFILSNSPKGEAVTVCEVSFHKSDIDHKYQPRLTFKRTDGSFYEKKVSGESLTQRITFQTGEDGYREFWKMISFLKGFKDLVDTGNFDEEYKIASHQEVLDYLKQKEKIKDSEAYKKIINELGNDSTSA